MTREGSGRKLEFLSPTLRLKSQLSSRQLSLVQAHFIGNCPTLTIPTYEVVRSNRTCSFGITAVISRESPGIQPGVAAHGNPNDVSSDAGSAAQDERNKEQGAQALH